MSKVKGHIDWFILLPITFLMLLSLTFVYSASFPYAEYRDIPVDTLFFNHLWKVLAGIIVIIVVSKIDYHHYRKFSKPLLIFSIILLIAVLFAGETTKGATRWLNLGFIRLQPSELAKFAMVLHFASMLASKQKIIKSLEFGFLPFVIWTGIILTLIAFQPNLSTLLVIGLISMAMMFVGNVNLLHLISTGFIGLVSVVFYAISAEYRLDRIKAYFGIDETGNAASTISYQLDQALLAIGNGGWTGVGPGQSRQSHLFLPESYGDFIFSIIGEEIGFLGLLLILVIYGVIFWRGLSIAKKAPDNFGYFLAIGIIITFAFYVFVNAGVNTGILPTTGVPLPFLSYGGTAVLLYSVAIGILLNISAQAGVFSLEEEDGNELYNIEQSENDDNITL